MDPVWVSGWTHPLGSTGQERDIGCEFDPDPGRCGAVPAHQISRRPGPRGRSRRWPSEELSRRPRGWSLQRCGTRPPNYGNNAHRHLCTGFPVYMLADMHYTTQNELRFVPKNSHIKLCCESCSLQGCSCGGHSGAVNQDSKVESDLGPSAG